MSKPAASPLFPKPPLQAVTFFENKFDVEAIRLDLPLATKAIEMLFTSIQVKENPTIAESLLSLKVHFWLITPMLTEFLETTTFRVIEAA